MPEINFVFNKPWISFQECVHLDLTVPMCFPTAISKDAGFSLETHLKKFFPTFFLTLSHVFLGHLFCLRLLEVLTTQRRRELTKIKNNLFWKKMVKFYSTKVNCQGNTDVKFREDTEISYKIFHL